MISGRVVADAGREGAGGAGAGGVALANEPGMNWSSIPLMSSQTSL